MDRKDISCLLYLSTGFVLYHCNENKSMPFKAWIILISVILSSELLLRTGYICLIKTI